MHGAKRYTECWILPNFILCLWYHMHTLCQYHQHTVEVVTIWTSSEKCSNMHTSLGKPQGLKKTATCLYFSCWCSLTELPAERWQQLTHQCISRGSEEGMVRGTSQWVWSWKDVDLFWKQLMCITNSFLWIESLFLECHIHTVYTYACTNTAQIESFIVMTLVQQWLYATAWPWELLTTKRRPLRSRSPHQTYMPLTSKLCKLLLS